MYELRLLQRDRPESSGKKDRVEGGPMKGNFGKWKGAEGASQVCIFGVGGVGKECSLGARGVLGTRFVKRCVWGMRRVRCKACPPPPKILTKKQASSRDGEPRQTL